MRFKWPVMPICDAQKLDVRPDDLLNDGLFRKCDTYRGGGGYDKFGDVWSNRKGFAVNPVQFVVQLQGCPLKCPYCYVTKQGVFGTPKYLTTEELLQAYWESNLQVFHLMGGAPALYLEEWADLAEKVRVFHSDLLLIEKPYHKDWLVDLPGVHAVSLKTKDLYTPDQLKLMWKNLDLLIESGVDFYLTYTGARYDKNTLEKDIWKRYGRLSKDVFYIEIQNYKALGVTTE